MSTATARDDGDGDQCRYFVIVALLLCCCSYFFADLPLAINEGINRKRAEFIAVAGEIRFLSIVHTIPYAFRS